MSEIDHRVGEGLERVVQPADALEAQQQPAELVLPGKYPLDRPEALLEDGRLEAACGPAWAREHATEGAFCRADWG
jgi:hypothetical protein